jgi:hypothetical protein
MDCRRRGVQGSKQLTEKVTRGWFLDPATCSACPVYLLTPLPRSQFLPDAKRRLPNRFPLLFKTLSGVTSA